jgi:hypothetical protein
MRDKSMWTVLKVFGAPKIEVGVPLQEINSQSQTSVKLRSVVSLLGGV